jgi:hypothetical protein
MSPDSSFFASMTCSSSIPVMIVDDTLMPLTSIGYVVTPHLSLLNVYFIPKLMLNIVYVGQLCDSGNYLVIFSSFFFA